ncbi:ribosomal RNA methyltransferase FtsJ domain-containing protein [Hygrophoropsis aurantiaca]|uniref:Ribosomal RNA methyltransferase FtsJ domain-containing protein n=1 Tax=Hygrophoropsis aurantiaca TaxID=72124 RepID=A0ACB8AFJ6_9AGAM|nr:ribosomal RNA methyltransferase FtsJ domain-containing protein [Hygrophoropsis aurantiaca]
MVFRLSPILQKVRPTQQSWLRRQYNDPYVRQRLSHPASYRSRSAFKLLEINEKWGKFLEKNDVQAVVDLGAAPGGWSQVVAGKMGWLEDERIDGTGPSSPLEGEGYGLNQKAKDERYSSWSVKDRDLVDTFDPLSLTETPGRVGKGVIVAVDLLRMAPIPGVHTLQMDFLAPKSSDIVMSALKTSANPSGKADVIISDMAANFTGNHITDSQACLDICFSAIEFASKTLKVADKQRGLRGGTLLLKHFAHPLLQEFRRRILVPNFHVVYYIKPDSSRSESAEGYWLCRGWTGKKQVQRYASETPHEDEFQQ